MTEISDQNINENYGNVTISDEAIADCVYQAVKNTRGIGSFSGGLSDAFSENILGKTSRYKGIKITQDDEKITIDIFITVEFGNVVPDIAWNAQKHIKDSLKNIVAKPVDKINVHVQGVVFEGENNEQK